MNESVSEQRKGVCEHNMFNTCMDGRWSHHVVTAAVNVILMTLLFANCPRKSTGC